MAIEKRGNENNDEVNDQPKYSVSGRRHHDLNRFWQLLIAFDNLLLLIFGISYLSLIVQPIIIPKLLQDLVIRIYILVKL